ncbi:GNAT family N-acetyltransferase [Terracoccus sp. 273MFTsu3.1]|uniref:GNAT family N-acetyltransferase n=1 Tax=Terracoccus sp. 273MFTsu3.1 TaxID=1172188 RepID=UPI000362E28F|nr:GNAT family N-acetyltransferase [Terracoccus sp. 273MFTsu3.1]
MTTSITVALASPAAHAEVIELASARLQHLTRAEVAWPFESPEVFTHLVVAVARDDDEHLLGIGLSLRPTFAPPDRSMLRVVVARDHEGRGVGSALRRFLLPHVPDTTRRLGGGVYDDEPRSLEIVRHWGFGVEEHAIDSALDLVEHPPEAPVVPAGVVLEEVPDLDFDDEGAVETMLRASQTNPEAAVGFVMTLEKFRAMTTSGETPICVVARVDGTPAGISYGTVSSGELFIAYSGIDPAFRGRSLMRLVKQQAHVAAASAGATKARTNNEEHNAGIRRINAELGYVVQSGVYRLVQDLSAAEPSA